MKQKKGDWQEMMIMFRLFRQHENIENYVVHANCNVEEEDEEQSTRGKNLMRNALWPRQHFSSYSSINHFIQAIFVHCEHRRTDRIQ